MNQTALLREAIKAQFYPFAEARGFVRGKGASLYMPFSRQAGERTEFFEIQWEKYGRPCFVLNFGEHLGPMPFNFREAEHIGRLQRWRGGSLRCWFQLRKPWLESLRTLQWAYTPEEVAVQLITHFAELEAWWQTRTAGRHVYIWRG